MLDFFILGIKVVFSLIFILCLIYLFFKYGTNKLQYLQNNKYLRIFERLSLSKDNSIFVIKMGSKGFVISSSNGKIEIIKEIPEEEFMELEKNKAFEKNQKMQDIFKKRHKKED